MPTIQLRNVATTTDALNGLKFKTQEGPALVSLYAAGATAADNISFSVNQREFVVTAAVNIEGAVDLVDTDRDQVLFSEPVPAGEYFLPVVATAGVGITLVIEPLTAR